MELWVVCRLFVTICTKDREHFLGETINCGCGDAIHGISTHKMELSQIGKIVESEWLKTTKSTTGLGTKTGYRNSFPPQSKNLSFIIRG